MFKENPKPASSHNFLLTQGFPSQTGDAPKEGWALLFYHN